MGADNIAAKHSKADAAASTPEQAATDTSRDVHNAMRDGGRDAAYDVLKKDVDAFVKEHGADTEGKKAYWESATRQLGDILPDLSIAFGDDNAKVPGAKPGAKPGDQTIPQIDPKAIELAAKTVRDAKDDTWLLMSSPDKTKIMNVLEPMSAAQRQAVQDSYAKQFPGHTLEQDLKEKLGTADFARVQAILKRQDGVADNSGQVWQALAKLPGSSGNDKVRVEGEIRDSLNTLTADQVKEVEAKFKKDFGKDLRSTLLDNPSLSNESKEALKVYFNGSDKATDADRLKLADIALKADRPDIFNEVFRNASQSARDEFKANGGMQKIDDSFWFGDKQIAKDYVERGSVSLSTIANGNTHWYRTNREDIDRSVSNATEQDRKDFKRGEQLSQQADQSNLTAEDKRALAFYTNVDAQLKNSGNAREAALWESKLRNNESVITNILQSHQEGSWFFGLGSGTDKNKQMSAVENMSEKDWKFLKGNPEEVAKIEKALNTFPDSNHDQIMSMLQAKLGKETFAESQNVGNRAIDERLKDSASDPAARADALAGMTAAERKAYAANTDGMRDKINGLLSTDAEKLLADRLSKTPGPVSPTDRVLIDGIKGATPASTFTDIEAAMKADPTLRDRLRNPQTAEDKQLSTSFHTAARAAVDAAGLGDTSDGAGGIIAGQYDAFNTAAFDKGHVPIDMQLQLTQDKDVRNSMVLHATDEERAKLLDKNPDAATKSFQERVFGTNKDVRQVLEYALQQKDPETGKFGYMDQADKFRMFAAQGDDAAGLKSSLEKMGADDRQNLANEYFTKFGKLVTDDVIGKVPSDQQWRFRELLSPTDVNVRQIALDAQLSNNSHTSFFDPMMNGFWDYTRVAADSTQDNLNKFVTEHAAELDKLSPETRKQFNDAVNNYMAAEKAYVDSKGKMAETLVDATLAVAAIGGAAFTGGTSLALLAEIGAGGALYRIAAMRAIQGTDFDGSVSNVAKQGFEGAAAAMLGFLGPEALGLKGLALGEKTAANLAERLVTGEGSKALFREGSEQAIKDTFATLTRQGAIAGDKQITALAERIAAQGVDKALVEKALKEQIKTEVMTGMRNVVLNEGEMFARNMVAAQLGAQGKELAATGLGFESPQTLFERMQGAALGTAVGATLFHSVFRVGAGHDYVKIALGKTPDGKYIAGGETPVRHADGRMEVVPPGKTIVLENGDTIAENVVPAKRSWGTMVKDGNGEIQHMDTPAGGFTKVPGKPDTFVDDFGKEVRLTDIRENADGSLSYHSTQNKTRWDGSPALDKDGNIKIQESDVVHPVAKTPEAAASVEQLRAAKDVASLKQAIDDAGAHSEDPAVRAAVRMAVIKELEDKNTNFYEVKDLIDSKFKGSKFDDVRPALVKNADGTVTSVDADERLSVALRDRAVHEVEKDPSRVFTDVNPAMRKAMDDIAKGDLSKETKKNLTNAINPNLSPEEKAAALYLLGRQNMPMIEQLISKLKGEYPDLQFESGIKKFETGLSKVLRPGKEMQVENLGDTVRFKTVMDNFEDLPKFVKELKDAGFKIINSDDASGTSNDWKKGTGWRAINFSLLMPNGQIAEFQMSIKEFEAIHGNHDDYNFTRAFDTKNATAKQRREYDERLERVMEKFDDAWKLHLKNTGKTEDQVNELINDMHKKLHLDNN
ncbi:MAG: hypothetical protein JST89_09950 [Cyanobacteria bacterium SZAS-4]|nr:hypothetical protein [Cyanobacteria bacterium SZAS-4]